jgi:anaerobic selenocysteine-containing dehydrogenase
MRWIVQAKEKGVNIIYVDPRQTATSNFCSLQVTPRPGSDGALALGIAHVLIKEGLFDQDYVKSHVNGFEDLSAAAKSYTPEKTSQITWIPAEKIVDLARTLGRSPATLLWMGGSISRYTNGILTVRNIIALQAITNNLDGLGKGIMDVLGGKPGGEDEFLEHYKDPGMAPKLHVRKILYNMKNGNVDVLLLNSTYRRYPDTNAVREAVAKVGLVVYRGFFMNEEAELAHVIIPGCMPFESRGSQYGSQRQVVWRSKIIEKLGDTVDELQFYTDLGQKLSPGKFPSGCTPEKLFEMVNEKVPSWKGLTLERVQATRTGVTWPSFSVDEPESRGSIFKDGRMATEDGKVLLNAKVLGPIRWEEPEGSPIGAKSEEDREFPLIFTQGKVVNHWHHSYTNWSYLMGQFCEGNYVCVHPKTAAGIGLQDGDLAHIETKIGKLKAKVKVTEAVLPGVIWTPSYPSAKTPVPGNHGVTINTIIPNYWDKVAAQFNGFGCRLVKA